MTTLIQDLQFALRSLAKNPGFTAAAVATPALGIGATVAIFSLVEASLLRGLPYRDPQRLVHVWETGERGEVGRHELLSLGAAPADIVRMVLVRASLPVAVSLAAGAAGNLAAARPLSGLLFGISLGDVTTLLAVGAALAAIAAAASLLPALRAAHLDPSRALRTE